MIVIPGRIPIAIHPFFWLFAALIGWINSATFSGTLIWVGIIFFSVLIHEFGHALTARLFRQEAKIQLVALGGLTSYDGPKLKFWQQFIIVFNGPLFGFFLFLAAYLILIAHFPLTPIVQKILQITAVANLFWTVVNLLPVMPLDGGQLLRIALEAFFGVKGYKASLLIGSILSGAIACAFFFISQFLVGAFFFLFAFQSFDLWRKTRLATVQDRDEDLKHLFIAAEQALALGKKEEAETLFDQIRKKTSKGLLYIAACQYLAFLDVQKGERKKAYELLLPLESELADESRALLCELAAENRNWELVAKLSSDSYQFSPSPQAALRNARAFAFLHQSKPAGGWLQTAWQSGQFDLENVLKEEEFQGIKNDPEFKKFTDQLK